jgi:3-oxoacyl-(acyl-carrier-protein) synthase
MTAPISHHWVSTLLDATGEAVAAWVAATLAEVEPALPGGDRVALHVATPDSGSHEALAFWRAAHVTGFAFAAPGAFPWTLSNSVTGRISLALGVTGPCTTWVGGPEAAAEARLAAEQDLEDGLVDVALVVSVAGTEPPDAVGSPVRVRLTVTVLEAGPALLPAPASAGAGVAG